MNREPEEKSFTTADLAAAAEIFEPSILLSYFVGVNCHQKNIKFHDARRMIWLNFSKS
jgi:hypothetical protein